MFSDLLTYLQGVWGVFLARLSIFGESWWIKCGGYSIFGDDDAHFCKMPLESSLNTFAKCPLRVALVSWFSSLVGCTKTGLHDTFHDQAHEHESWIMRKLISHPPFGLVRVGIMVPCFHKIGTFNVVKGQETCVHWLKGSKVNTLSRLFIMDGFLLV